MLYMGYHNYYDMARYGPGYGGGYKCVWCFIVEALDTCLSTCSPWAKCKDATRPLWHRGW